MSVIMSAAALRPRGVRGLARLLVLPLTGLAVGLLIAVLVTGVLPASYRSTASVVLVPKQQKASAANAGSGVGLALNLTASVAQLAESRAVADAAARSIGLTDSAPGDAGGGTLGLDPEGANQIEATAETGNQIVTITATAGTAGTAARLANAAAAQTTALYSRLKLSGTSDVTLQQLDVATPAARPDQPQPLLDASLGALAGLLIGIGALALARRSDDRFRGVAEIESALQLPTVGRFRNPARPRPADRAALLGTLTLLAADHPLRRVLVTGVGRDRPTVAVAETLVAALRTRDERWQLRPPDTGSGRDDDTTPVVLTAPQLFADERTTALVPAADAVLLVVDSSRAPRAGTTRAGRLLGRTWVPVVDTVVVGAAAEQDGWRPGAWSDRALPTWAGSPRHADQIGATGSPVTPAAPHDATEAVANGTSTNGTSTNGTSTNGTSTNGTSTNGTSTNGRSTGTANGSARTPVARKTTPSRTAARKTAPTNGRTNRANGSDAWARPPELTEADVPVGRE